jgi:hypothetical protein
MSLGGMCPGIDAAASLQPPRSSCIPPPLPTPNQYQPPRPHLTTPPGNREMAAGSGVRNEVPCRQQQGPFQPNTNVLGPWMAAPEVVWLPPSVVAAPKIPPTRLGWLPIMQMCRARRRRPALRPSNLASPRFSYVYFEHPAAEGGDGVTNNTGETMDSIHNLLQCQV